jgi:hypothetical protein
MHCPQTQQVKFAVANLKATCKWHLVIAVQEIVVRVTAARAMVALAIAVQVTVVQAIAALEIVALVTAVQEIVALATVAPETGVQVKS